MQYLSDWQVAGFFMMVLGLVFGIVHAFSRGRDSASGMYLASVLAITAGMLIVVIASLVSTPANHAGVGFYMKKSSRPPEGTRRV